MNSECKEAILSLRSAPIIIPKKNNTKNNTKKLKYDLIRSNMMPDNSSPPNSWKSRLKIRLDKYR